MKKNGFSLVEVMISVVVVSLILTGFLTNMARNLYTSADANKRFKASAYAKMLMEEIKTKKFDEKPIANPSWTTKTGIYFASDSGETNRLNWDDVDDYDGYGMGYISGVGSNQEPIGVGIVDISGNMSTSDYTARYYHRTVKVDYVDDEKFVTPPAITPSHTKRVTVTCYFEPQRIVGGADMNNNFVTQEWYVAKYP